VRDEDVRERVAQVEGLLGRLPEDPAYTEALRGVVELYGEALRRLVGRIPAEEVVEDELVSHLLLVHGLHPVDVETRVRQALDDVRPYLGTHGGDVELVGVEDGVARLRLAGTCNGCPSSAVTLRNAIEEAILRAAPDVDRVEAEGAVEPDPQPTLLQIGSLRCPTELQRA
jgi:Fe-S cluster biogenesis protein NfuA